MSTPETKLDPKKYPHIYRAFAFMQDDQAVPRDPSGFPETAEIDSCDSVELIDFDRVEAFLAQIPEDKFAEFVIGENPAGVLPVGHIDEELQEVAALLDNVYTASFF